MVAGTVRDTTDITGKTQFVPFMFRILVAIVNRILDGILEGVWSSLLAQWPRIVALPACAGMRHIVKSVSDGRISAPIRQGDTHVLPPCPGDRLRLAAQLSAPSVSRAAASAALPRLRVSLTAPSAAFSTFVPGLRPSPIAFAMARRLSE